MCSWVRKFISAVMVLTLIVTGVYVPFPNLASAEASVGNNQVSVTPDTLMSMGEWQYWVEDGRAIIAGYENENVTSLKIPGNLGGYPVSAIGHMAFSKLLHLSNIQIHTNISSIASDAFDSNNTVHIEAYNGSYALQYASEKGIPYVNLSSAAVFVNNVIDLTGLSSSKVYSGLSEKGVSFIEKEATFLKEGQILYFPAQVNLPTGLAKQVANISSSNGRIDVSFSQPQWGEVFIRVQGEDELFVDWNNAQWGEGFQPDADTSASGSITGSTYSVGLGVNVKLGKVDVKGNIELSLKKPTVKWDIGLGWWGIIPYPDIKLIDIKLPFEHTENFTLSLTTDGKKNNIRLEPREQIRGEKCNLAKVPVASAGGIVNGYLTLDMVFEISGEAKISSTILTTITFTYQNGKFTANKTKTENHSFSLSGSAKVGPELKLYFVLGWAGFVIRFFEASIGVFVVAEGSLTWTKVSGTVHYVNCKEVSVKVKLEVGAKAGLIKLFDKNIDTYLELKGSWELWDFGKLHWEEGYLVENELNLKIKSIVFRLQSGSCSLENRTLYYDTGISTIKETHDVNEFLKEPTLPSRPGYKFEGWYLDAKASGIPGNDYKIVYGYTQMPYAGRTGSVYIRAKWKDINPLTYIELNKSTITGFSNMGTTAKLTTTKLLPANANNKSVKWSSSNTNVAAVDQNGNVKLKNTGEAVITCTSVGNPSVKATCNVTVKQSVTGIQLSPNNVFRYSDNMNGFQITHTVLPSNAAEKDVVWSSSNTSVAIVSDTGYVTLKGIGTATITCQSVQNPNISGKCTIAVRQAVTGITLNKESELRTNANMSPLQLIPTVAPSNAFNKAVTWTSSNTNVATVSADGLVSMKSVGKAVITCTSVSNPDKKATFNLEIIQAVTDILLNEISVTRYSDQTEPVQLTAEIFPGDAGNKAIIWTSSDPDVITVDANGLVSIIGTKNQKEAHATVTCQSVSNPEVIAECKFTILQAVTGIDLNQTLITTSNDEVNPAYLTATLSPSYAYNKAVTWTSSNSSVATVTNDGIVVYKGIGQATITCTSVSTPDITKTCTVNVTEAVSGLSLSERSIVRYSNQTEGVQLIATLDAAPVADREVRWTTDNASVATVTDSGIVSTHNAGSAVITCTSISNPDVSAECLVIVRQSVTNIVLNETTIERDSDNLGTVQLIAAVSPSTAANMDIAWESNNLAVATVDDSGMVILVGPGTATITCRSLSDPEIYATCAITIHQAVTSIRLNISELTKYTSDTSPVHLIAYCYPSYANNKDVIWGSSNTDVVTISDDGTVAIVGAGTATISCRSISKPDLTALCSVNIKQAINTITLSEETLSLFSDRTSSYNLTATISPDNAENKAVIWSSSNTDVVYVSDNGQLIVSGTGFARVTCRAVSNPNAYATCAVTVKQAVQSIVINESELVCYADDTTEYQLIANIQPAHADNKNITWESSDPDVVTVADDGTLTIIGIGSSVVTCTSELKTSIIAQCNVIVKQPMTAIFLNDSAVELYNDSEEGVQLNATVIPDETDDTDIIWESDNEYVAIVSDNGLIQPIAKGIAHITCSSARRPESVFTTCTVEVKQQVEAVEIEGDTASLLPNETVQLIAKCYPDIANNKNIIWSSDNPNTATVNNNGLVTALDYGAAVITAVSTDGSNIAATYVINVEHELVLETDIENDTLYSQGNNAATIATVRLGNSSAKRMAEAGYDIHWTLSKPDDNDDIDVDILTTSFTDLGRDYESTYALLSGSYADTVGSRTYTITCSAGPYTETADITIKIVNTEIPDSVILEPSTYTSVVGEAIILSNNLTSGDSKPVPSGLEIISINGDEYFTNNSSVSAVDNGYKIIFNESGIYNTTIQYAVKNVAYAVNVSFYIQDENGIIHIRTESVELDESYLVLVQDASKQLNYTITPLDAYDTTVTWSSSDESVARVDQNGIVTAVSPGIASIACVANDGHGATALCAVAVENFLQLDDISLDYTVFTGGNDHADLGIVNVTIESERRLSDAGLNVTWSLAKISGSSCDIAVEEFKAEAEESITVSGNRIKLLRIHNAGTDQYRLTCKAGEYTANCEINIQVIESVLPSTITLGQSEYSGTVNEILTIDTTYSPAVLPESTRISICGGNAFESALSDQYDFTDPENIIFDAPGTYDANVIFSGDNYIYTCPITIVISDEDGNVPVNITDLRINPEALNLLVGEQATLTCEADPLNASFSKTSWTSSDTGIATVSSNGTVTAISAGMAFISVSVPESDFEGGCMVTVEDGLTLRESSIERTVFVDGITRTQLDTVQLTASSSKRLDKAPEWSLSRVSGNNLTLKVKEYNSSDANGDLNYGCSIILYSMSREGDTKYELTCSADGDTVTIPITIHAVNRNQDIPSGLSLTQNTFTASVNELIQIIPDIVCLPAGTMVPDGMRVTLEGNALFNNSVNANDYCVSRNMTAISFNRAGLFEANYIFSYSNMRYIVPVTFRIMDEVGKVPVLATNVSLSNRSLWLTEGETTRLNAVFTPAEADNRMVSWTSTDTTVATVDNDGTVRAIGKGRAEIICQPAETYLSSLVCTVWVEDYLSWETSEDRTILYKQGKQENEVFSATLSEGTKARLSKADITPVWSLTRINGSHSDIILSISEQNDSITVTSSSLISGGSDEYSLLCTAGDYTKTINFTVEVVEEDNIAESISLSHKQINTSIGETVTIDFTPICEPFGSHIPQSNRMWNLFAGIGQNFHDAVDYDVYAENGDIVTIRFTKPGRYLLSRQFFLDNLHYQQVCEIVVDQPEEPFHLLQTDTVDTVVYIGGTAGAVAHVNVSDALMLDVFERNINWILTHISGDSMDAVLKDTNNGVELFTVGADHPGENTWRVTCTFGDYSEYVDIHIDVREPRNDVPKTVELSMNRISGVTGNWLTMPIAVSYVPEGSSLPETGDDFWKFTPMGLATDVCSWDIEDGLLRVQFRWPGYYTGILTYEAGNFRYSMPVYMVITDEEGVITPPDLEIYLLNVPDAIYADGKVNTAIGTAELSHGVGSYYAGEAAAYMNTHENEWSISITSGNAVSLGIEKADNNSARIIVNNINNPGAVTYRINCSVEGKNYSKSGELTILDSSADHPDPALRHSVYYAATGEKLIIPTMLYDQGSGAILQGTAKWIPDTLLSAIGYEYIEKSDCLQMTFYKEGTYNSVIDAMIGNLTYEIPITIIISNTSAPHSNILKLPTALTAIEDYAFEGISADIVDLRGTRITHIGTGAFSRCTELESIYIPPTVTSIGYHAFYGCLNLTIICKQGSAADAYANQHNVPVRYE